MSTQTTRLHTHEQSLVRTLQRRRNNGTDRHEQRSQGSDRQNRITNRPQDSTDPTNPTFKEKNAKKESKGGDTQLNWNEHTISIYQAHQELAPTRPTTTRRPITQQRRMSTIHLSLSRPPLHQPGRTSTPRQHNHQHRPQRITTTTHSKNATQHKTKTDKRKMTRAK